MSAATRARLGARLVAIAAATAAWAPSTAAHADDFSGGAGVYVSFTFGKELGVGYGLEGHFMGLLVGNGSCSNDRRGGIGGMFQIGGINGSTLRIAGGVQGGVELGDRNGTPAIVGEMGLAAHVAAKKPGLGWHTGLLLDTGYSANIFGRAEWFLEEYSVGVGGRFFGTFGPPGGSGCVIGRPLRSDDGRVELPDAYTDLVARDAPRFGRDRARAVAPEWLAAEWSAAAQAEAASVPAFVQLASELLALGAPADLVDAALDAAEDEIRHARACARLASRWSGRRVTPRLPATPRRAAPTLARVAVESWIDGCLGEGAAAERARLGASSAVDPRTARALEGITHDEARHAELGWRVLDWAMRAGGTPVIDAVRAARDVGLAEETAPSPKDALDHGCVPSALANALHARHVAVARGRLDAHVAAI